MAHLQNRSSRPAAKVLQKSHQANARQNRHEMTELQTDKEEGQHTTAVWQNGG